MNKSVNIIVVEPSILICEGLTGILNKSGLKYQLSFAGTMEEMELLFTHKKCELAIINPSYIQNNLKSFHALKCRYNAIQWLGIIYAYYDQGLLSLFDALINVSDTPETVASTINKLLAVDNQHGQNSLQEVLSERETDVLKLLATGMANKVIAEKLNISTNTVITHRKNISQKTGIKSVSGLTIYAVVQKLVSIESLSE